MEVDAPGIRRRSFGGRLPGRVTLPEQRPDPGLFTQAPEIDLREEDVPEERKIAEQVEVRVFDETTLSKEDMRTQQIINWIKRHPHDLPGIVKTHMDYEQGDHLSLGTMKVDGRDIDLYLMVRSGYAQLHVLMVMDENSYLFINRGIQNDASRFRVGKVSENFSRIISQEREITSEESQKFYATFIMWWESVQSQQGE